MKNHVRSGFTLLELLVAVSVAGVLILACGAMMAVGSEEQRRVSSKIEWERQIGPMVEQLTADLTSAHARSWHEGKDSDSCVAAWFALKSKKDQSEAAALGDLCAVAYALRDLNLDSNSGVVTRCVVRMQKDSQTCYQAIEEGNEDALWKMDGMGELLATGVLKFELWPLLQDGMDEWLPWNPELNTMPEVVELRVILASSGLQKRLQTRGDWEWARLHLDQISEADYRELRTLIYLGPDAD